MALGNLQQLRNLYFMLMITLLTVFRTESSALQENPEKDSAGAYCPKGWYHYKNFCMTRGKGGSEKAVAFYCDGFGGIGIKGLCITSAKNSQPPANEQNTSSQEVHRRALLKLSLGLSGHRHVNEIPMANHPRRMDGSHTVVRPTDVDASSFGSAESGPDDVNDEGAIEARVCPSGWTHYRSMCIYKPWTTGEACNLFSAIEFNGLCIKHADTEGLSSSEYQMYYKLGKRVCCCNHVRARGNQYGC